VETKPNRPPHLLTIALVALLLVAACTTPTSGDPTELVLVTHDSFAVSDGIFASFEEQTGVSVRVLTVGDAGILTNQAILTRSNPTADVLFGIDNTFLSRALDADLFVPYRSPALEGVPVDLIVDPDGRVTPIDFGDVCINFDKAAFADRTPPGSLADLTRPEFAGELVVENPATSSPGLAFLLATIATFGDDGWQSYWADLVANDVLVVPDWETAYYGRFTGGGGSDRTMVVSYASSPPAEVIFAETTLTEAPTAVVTEGCFRQIEFAGILRDSAPARQLVDFLLSEAFQEDIPLNMFVFPALSSAALPSEFVEFTELPTAPATLDPALIEANRDIWIDEWTSIVLP